MNTSHDLKLKQVSFLCDFRTNVCTSTLQARKESAECGHVCPSMIFTLTEFRLSQRKVVQFSLNFVKTD